MNKRVKKLWVAALRSGEYEQGFGQLHPGKLYCCLGVLCDLYVGETGGDGDAFDNIDGILASSVVEWAGLDSQNPLLGKEEATINNDGSESVKPKTFAQISNLIQRYL